MSFRVRGDVGRVLAVCSVLALVATTARAQEAPLPTRTLSPLFTQTAPLTAVPNEPTLESRFGSSADRGVLVPLYISFASLQMLDALSTLRTLRAGGVEQNPLLRGFAHKPAALVAFKAGTAVSTIALVDITRNRNRVGAIVLMAALNSFYVAVVAHNYRTVP